MRDCSRLDIGTHELRPLPGSEGIYPISPPPFFSNDSRSVLYGAEGQLRKSDVTGTTSAQVIAVTDRPFLQGGTQNHDNVIVYANDLGILMKVSETDRMPKPLTLMAPGETGHRWPQFLKDGRHFLYQRVSITPGKTGVYIGSIDAAPEAQNTDPLWRGERQAYWVSSSDGRPQACSTCRAMAPSRIAPVVRVFHST